MYIFLLERDGQSGTIRECAEPNMFKLQQNTCYDFLDPEVWGQITEGNEGEILDEVSRYDISFCTSDMCNAAAGACESESVLR